MISANLLLGCGISSDNFFAEALACKMMVSDENGRIMWLAPGLADYLLASGCTMVSIIACQCKREKELAVRKRDMQNRGDLPIICRSESYWGLISYRV